jgi:serine phosphatase RsbU (regulator of sigma subunit)
VLVTDGITEASADGAEELGDDRLLAALRERRHASASETAARVLELARRFAQDDLADDATVVVADVSAEPTPA